jgi:hypothetical protein
VYNLLIAEPVPENWTDEIRRNARSELDADDELNLAVPDDVSGNERRKQLLAYLLEVRG